MIILARREEIKLKRGQVLWIATVLTLCTVTSACVTVVPKWGATLSTGASPLAKKLYEGKRTAGGKGLTHQRK